MCLDICRACLGGLNEFLPRIARLFGMKNVLFGWTALVTPNRCEMAAEKKECKYCPLTGLYLAIVNTAGGAVHAATFLIPVDIPLPNNGTQFVK